MISMNWVKDYIDLKGENLEELADKVTKAGVNVEHVISNNIKNKVYIITKISKVIIPISIKNSPN